MRKRTLLACVILAATVVGVLFLGAVLEPGPTEATHGSLWHTVDRASLANDGSQSDGFSYGSSISSDGRFVAFESFATNLIPGGGNGFYVRDRQSASTATAPSEPFFS